MVAPSSWASSAPPSPAGKAGALRGSTNVFRPVPCCDLSWYPQCHGQQNGFRVSVAISDSGDVAWVGAPATDDEELEGVGAAYFFELE